MFCFYFPPGLQLVIIDLYYEYFRCPVDVHVLFSSINGAIMLVYMIFQLNQIFERIGC